MKTKIIININDIIKLDEFIDSLNTEDIGWINLKEELKKDEELINIYKTYKKYINKKIL